jgi:hypothetical protein
MTLLTEPSHSGLQTLGSKPLREILLPTDGVKWIEISLDGGSGVPDMPVPCWEMWVLKA